MPLRDLSVEDQARYRNLAQAVRESIRNIDRLEFQKKGLRLREGVTKSDVLYLVIEAARETKPGESETEYVAQRLPAFLLIERRQEERQPPVPERRKKDVA
jgi:hypothetical protein